MARKSLAAFVREHRAELTAFIRGQVPNVGPLNDAERADWVLNDERLYQWARSEGATIDGLPI